MSRVDEVRAVAAMIRPAWTFLAAGALGVAGTLWALIFLPASPPAAEDTA